MKTDGNMKKYFIGEKIYGDGFSHKEIEAWFKDEEEAYAELGSKNKDSYNYSYHAINWILGFSRLKNQFFSSVLGIGSAYGDEFKPIEDKIEELTILEPSKQLQKSNLKIPVKYIHPDISGKLPFKNQSFDLITSLGVLHHVPNVSFVIQEISRCTKNGGWFLLREPVVSMGDWRKKRANLTKRERGIPLDLLRKILKSNNFEIITENKCVFPFIPMLGNILGIQVYNSRLLVFLDKFASKLFSWNNVYHPKNNMQKIRPGSVFFVLRKKNK